MLISKLLGSKKIIKKFGLDFTDLISSTFKLNPDVVGGGGTILVNEYENMRPDLIADRIYGDITQWDALLKYNGISNPFSIQKDTLLFATSDSVLSTSYTNAREIPVRDQKSETVSNPTVNPNTQKDKDRLDNLKKKNKGTVLPPNINKPGDSNTQKSSGKVTFGANNTAGSVKKSNPPISRKKLQIALKKDNIII